MQTTPSTQRRSKGAGTETNVREKRRLPQRSCRGPFGQAGAGSRSLMFVARAGNGVGRKCLEAASSAHTRPVSPLGCPLELRLCLDSWLSCSVELACRDLQVGSPEACSTVFRERMVLSDPKNSALTHSIPHGCPGPAPPTQCLFKVLSQSTNLLSNIYLPNIYLYTHSHIHIHSHRYLIRGKVQYWASLLTRGKELPANAGDMTSIPGSGRCPGEGNGNPVHYSWEIPWTEEPGGLQSMGSQKVRHN